jgi:ABC-type Mn2+/Zn2+ transport system ATPase subunit
MVMIKLQVKDIVFAYGEASPILNNVCIEVAPSKVLSIVGPNGSGKSTLLYCWIEKRSRRCGGWR